MRTDGDRLQVDLEALAVEHFHSQLARHMVSESTGGSGRVYLVRTPDDSVDTQNLVRHLANPELQTRPLAIDVSGLNTPLDFPYLIAEAVETSPRFPQALKEDVMRLIADMTSTNRRATESALQQRVFSGTSPRTILVVNGLLTAVRSNPQNFHILEFVTQSDAMAIVPNLSLDEISNLRRIAETARFRDRERLITALELASTSDDMDLPREPELVGAYTLSYDANALAAVEYFLSNRANLPAYRKLIRTLRMLQENPQNPSIGSAIINRSANSLRVYSSGFSLGTQAYRIIWRYGQRERTIEVLFFGDHREYDKYLAR